ncbi:hypothetical protein CRM22_010809 [Opisthorchis felineus]|uniref:GPI transamidase subunit PIG-U n=1 Tax=Opisthorchis felineus TaxID=147828 RepID=A0A4V3SAU9_OPIFE|nr:hypothetical protein CRM22_010809 [Opisthorchis felineus]
MRPVTVCLVILLGLALRLLFKRYASQTFINSFAYSPVDQWDSILEGVFLLRSGLPVYDNDIVHQPPLALHLWSLAVSYIGESRCISCFLIMELVMIFSMMRLCNVFSKVLLALDSRRKKTNTAGEIHPSSQDLLVSENSFIGAPIRVLICYCFNPFSILAFAAQSTSIVWNIICVWTMITCFQDHLFISSCLCALGCYLRLYPGYLLLPILAVAYVGLLRPVRLPQRVLRITSCLVGFVGTFGGLIWGSYVLEGHDWSFMDSIYLHQLRFVDCTPQLGIYWYLFVEMFEHFYELFIWVFQLLLASLVVAMLMRFYEEPVFLCYTILLITNVLQPYHSIGEFGYLIALLPVWGFLQTQCRLYLPTTCVLLASLVLTPLFHYMWLQPGTANANFYFAACMVYAVGQIFLITDMLNSFVRREYLLRVGSKLQLSSGQQLVLVNS